MPTIADLRARLPELEGLDDEQAVNVIQQVYYPSVPVADIAARLGVKPKAPPVEPRSATRAVGDAMLNFGQGVSGGVRMLTDLAGADNPVSQGLRGVDSFLEDYKSAQAKGDAAEQQRILSEAEDQGVGAQVAAAIKAFAKAPVQTMAQAAGSVVPSAAAALVTGGMGPGLMRLGLPAFVGSAQGVGSVKGQIYDSVKEQYLKDGASEAEADAKAAAAQEYSSGNADQMALGAGLGALEGATGVQRAIGTLKAGVTKPAHGLVRRVAEGGLEEGIPEVLQSGQQQMAGNIALQREGYNVPTERGVAGQAALGGIAGVGLGGMMGTIKPHERPATLPMVERVAEPAVGVLDAGSVDEAIAAAKTATSAKPAKPTDNGLAALGDTAMSELGPLDRQEALRLIATAQNPKAGPGVRAYAKARLQEMLTPAAGLPGAEVTESELLPTGEAAELSPEQVDEMILRRPTPSQRAAAKGPLPVGEATELEPETIEDGGTIPVGDVIETGGPRPEGMAERTPRADAVPVDRAMPTAVQQYVDRMRGVNTPAARAFVREFEAGRITPAEVADLIVPPKREPTADERLAAAAAQAPKAEPGDLVTTDGMPYGSKIAALARARKEGLPPTSVIEIPNAGYVVRPKETPSVNQPDVAGVAPLAAGAGDERAPAAVGSRGDMGRVADVPAGVRAPAAAPVGSVNAPVPAGAADAGNGALIADLRKKWPGLAREPDEGVLIVERLSQAENRLKALDTSGRRADQIKDEVLDQFGGDAALMRDKTGNTKRQFQAEWASRMEAEAARLQEQENTPGTIANARRNRADRQRADESAAAVQKATEQDIAFNMARVREMERQGRLSPADAQRLLQLARTTTDGFDAAMKLEDFVSEKSVQSDTLPVGRGAEAANVTVNVDSDDLPTLKRKWAEAARAGRTEEAKALNERIVALKGQKVDTSAGRVQETAKTEQVAPAPSAPAPSTAVTERQELFAIGPDGKRYPVESVQKAQALWEQFRDSTGAGGSQIGNGVRVVDQRGNFVARISYNGRAWSTEDKPGIEQRPIGEEGRAEELARKRAQVEQWAREARGEDAALPAPAAQEAAKPQEATPGFDSKAFDDARNATIKASREAGNTHLDQVPAYVETMRGKRVYYAHDPKVQGTIRTVDNNGNVYIDWADDYSAQKEMASPVRDGKRTVMRSSIGPRDLKDYVLAKEATKPLVDRVKERAAKAKAEKAEPAAPAGKRDLKGEFLASYEAPQEAGSARAALDRTVTWKDGLKGAVGDHILNEYQKGARVVLSASGPAFVHKDMRGWSKREIGEYGMQFANWLSSQDDAKSEPAPATHQDPGQPAEAATAPVVAKSIAKAARVEDRKPSAMKAELLASIDAAIKEAPDYGDFEAVVKTMGLKQATLAFTDARGTLGEKGAPPGYSRPKRTFNVEGDGVFTIQNSVRQLLTFRAKVDASPGFRDKQPATGLNERATDALDRRNTDGAIANMLDEGDFQAALDFAEAKGVDMADVKLTKVLRERLEKWQKGKESEKRMAEYQAAQEASKPAPGSLAAAFAEKEAADKAPASEPAPEAGVASQTFDQWVRAKYEGNEYKDKYLEEFGGDERRAMLGAALGTIDNERKGSELLKAARAKYMGELLNLPRETSISLDVWDALDNMAKTEAQRHFYDLDARITRRTQDETKARVKAEAEKKAPYEAAFAEVDAEIRRLDKLPGPVTKRQNELSARRDRLREAIYQIGQGKEPDGRLLRNEPTPEPAAPKEEPAPTPAEPPHFAELRDRTRAYWDQTGIPAIREYLRAFDAFGADRLERNRIKPEGMSAREWLESWASRQSKWEGGRKVQDTGVQALSAKDLWPTSDGAGERLRKAMLAAVKALKNAPSTTSELLAEAYMEKPAAPKEEVQAEAPAKVEAKPEKGVTNFGEELPPARRQLAAKLNESLTDDEVESRPFSQLWPAAENDAIEDTFAAAVAHTARDMVPAKPRTAYKLRRWVENVQMLRDLAGKIVGGRVTREQFLDEAAKKYALREFVSKVRLLEQIDRAQWKRIGAVQESPDAYTFTKEGLKVATPTLRVEVDGKTNWVKGTGRVDDSIAGVNQLLAAGEPEKRMQFEIRRSTSSGEVFINKKGDPEYRKLMTFTSVPEARAAMRDKYDALVSAWEAVKATDNVSERDVRSDVNRPRAGDNYRKGKDVDPDTFMQTFGFRGVEFGNWVAQGAGARDRQGMLNQAYDGLMDLAAILKIPPRAVSLNGTLGLAFGSRGSGWASAHYEPSNLVINLTKTRGAGTLAHEWFHALDNHFSHKRTGGEVPMTRGMTADAYRDANYITHKPERMMVRKDGRGAPTLAGKLESMRKANPNSGYLAAENWMPDPKHPAGVRPEVEEGFAAVVKALNESPMVGRARMIDKGAGGYWSRTLEVAARSFENYVIAKMMDRGFQNDFLANVKSVEDFKRAKERYPYLLPEEVKPVAEAFDNLFGTIKTRDTDKGVEMFSLADEPTTPWYSELARQLEASPMASAPASGWKQYALGLTRKGVKREELEWSGLTEWLDMQQGKVPKAAVLEFLRGNGVQVTETVLADNMKARLPEGWEVRHSQGNFESQYAYVLTDENGEIRGAGDTQQEAMEDGWDPDEVDATPTKYGQYTLPGGTNYREVLLTLPVKTPKVYRVSSAGGAVVELRDVMDFATREEAQAELADRERALPRQYHSMMEFDRLARDGGPYRSNHWDQPNILAHIRVNDRTDADGARVLFVEEVQSDWGQDAKKYGTLGTGATRSAERDALYTAARQALFRNDDLGFDSDADAMDAIRRHADWRQRWDVSAEDADAIDAYMALPPLANRARQVPNAPFVDSTDKWVSLALKRVIKMAVDEGYDKVAFVNGEQSAERYDLSKQIEAISYVKKKDDTYNVEVMGKGRRAEWDRTMIPQGITADRLADYIGKDLADKIQRGEGREEFGGRRMLSGLDLKVGGEGMRAFYDQIVPKVAKEVLRKLGGGAMGTVSIEDWYDGRDERGTRVMDPEPNGQMLQQPGFTITPAMRERAAGGLPMFDLKGWGSVDGGATPVDISAYAAADPEDRAAVERLQSALETRGLRGIRLDALPARAGQAAGQPVRGTDRDRVAVLQLAKRVFDKRATYFTASVPFANGVVSSTQPNRIFLRFDMQSPHLAVFGHELTHSMRADRPDLYEKLAERIGAITTGRDERDEALQQRYERMGLKRLADDKVNEEFLADVVGDNFTDPEFWRTLAAGQPAGFKRVMQAVQQWLDDVIQRITKIRPFGTDRYLTDLNAAREAVADAIRNYSAGEVGTVADEQVQFSLRQDQTDTPEFRAWFGDSKVVDAEGKPLVVYHGTGEDIASFDPTKIGANYPKWSRGFYFASTPGAANEYALSHTGANMASPEIPGVFSGSPADTGKGGANIVPVYLSMQNPLVKRARGYLSPDQSVDRHIEKWLAEAKADGRDGLIVRAGKAAFDGRGDVYVAFKPEQIKSAIGNRGTFDPADPDIRFSLADDMPGPGPGIAQKRTVQQQVRNTLHDMLGRAGARVTWWEKTIGTQYAKAEKHPEFKRVFDRAQQYLEDTSTLANEAADQANTILPKMETWADFKNAGGLKDADAKAIAAPIFKGTLEDKQRYDESTLRSKFGLNDSQVKLYSDFFAAVNTSLDQAVAADVLRLLGDKNPALRELAISDRAALREGVQGFLQEQIDAGIEPESNQALLEQIRDKYDRIQKLKEEGYAPLMRFGQYSVHVIGEDGSTKFFGLYEDRKSANRMARELGEDPEFKGAKIEQGVLSQDQYRMFAGMPLDSLELFANAIGADQSQVFQDYIRLATSNRSAMKRLLKRKGTAGFSEDVPRVLAAFVTSNARMASGAMNLPGAKEAAMDIRAGDVKDEAIKLLEAVENPGQTAGAMRGLMFGNFIGGSIASAVVNLTQPITMTLPYLSQYGGGVKAAARLMAAGKMAASGRVADPELRKALARAEAEGIVSPQEIHHLTAQAMGAWGTNPWVRRLGFVWAAPFSLAEQFNRRATFLAAYKTAQEEGMADPMAFAEKAVVETQGTYNKGNASNWARNPVGAVALTFKQFSVHYLEWLGRMWRSGPEGKKAVGMALALLIVAAGTDGLPFADDLDDVIDTLGQALGYDFNSKVARRNFVANTLGLGDEVADVAARGLSAMPGVPLDVSLRMSTGNLVPGSGLFLRSNTDKSQDVMEFAGAGGGLAKQAMDAGTKVLKGDVSGALLAGAPLAIQNAAKGIGMWQTGEARDQLGRKVMDADAVDGLMKFLGFNPQAVARESQKMGMIRRSEQLAKNVEGDIVGQWARAVVDGDAEGIADARKALADWNADNPDQPIRITPQQIRDRAKKLKQDRASRFITSTSPERRARVREELAL